MEPIHSIHRLRHVAPEMPMGTSSQLSHRRTATRPSPPSQRVLGYISLQRGCSPSILCHGTNACKPCARPKPLCRDVATCRSRCEAAPWVWLVSSTESSSYIGHRGIQCKAERLSLTRTPIYLPAACPTGALDSYRMPDRWCLDDGTDCGLLALGICSVHRHV